MSKTILAQSSNNEDGDELLLLISEQFLKLKARKLKIE